MEVLPLVLSPAATHYVYLRKHESKGDGSIPGDRTLFAANLPVDCTERQLAQFFKAHNCGQVEKVVFAGARSVESAQDGLGENSDDEESEQPVASSSKIVPLPAAPAPLHTSGQTAHIIFLDSSSIPLTLALPKSKSAAKKLKWPPSTSSDDTPIGLARFTAIFDARHPSLSLSREHADSYMEDFEQRAEAAKLAAAQTKYKKGEAIVDEDGFTLVTRGGAYGATLGGGAGVVSRKFQLDANAGVVNESEGKKRKKKEKPDFYTFQVREQKRKDFMDLRRRFEDDKAKISKLKESRRFKPY